MPSNQVKLEEREMRKMLKDARSAKKEAAKKARRHPKKKQAEEEVKRRFKPKGVMVLKSELAESETPASDVQGSAKKGKKQPRKSGGSAASSEVPVAPANTTEPPYSFEIHHKNKTVLVDVTLHKVPPHCIDVEQTSATFLVVQTPKYTKKFFLAFQLPTGIRIDPSKAEYIFDTGVLKCVLPIAGDIPPEVQAEREKLIESFRQQKSLRFRVSKEGDLVVRARRTTLTNEAPAAAKTVAKTQATGDQSKKEGTATGAASSAAKKAASSSSTADKQVQLKAAPKAREAKKEAAAAPKESRKHFVDDEKMVAIAAAAGSVQKKVLSEKLEQAKAMQEKRSDRVYVRESRRTMKKSRDQEAFERVLSEQKRLLLQRSTLAAPAPVKQTDNKKQVSFA